MDFLPRRSLPHAAPSWVRPGSAYFLTICALSRGENIFCEAKTAGKLFDAANFYQKSGEWQLRLILLMPDHLHALVSFPLGSKMRHVVGRWKSFTAKSAGVRWQSDFFDHRLRGNESLELKARYIRENPVRAGFVRSVEDWPWVFED